ncbi:50S ribosomal protein L10 [bacterium]|jgi:large subunit ribosomal protein L10|nr:50S ribosomal protein L10 [bacterium]
MNRQQKETFVQKLNQQFSGAQAAFVVNYQGLTVAQIQTLRFALYDKGAKFQVAKNRLSKIALPSMAGADALVPHLKGQLALVFAKDDVTGVAKIINDFARENEQLKIVAGCFEAELFSAAQVKNLASIPSREVLLAQLCGVLNAPITQFAVVIDQIAKKKASESEGSETVVAAE